MSESHHTNAHFQRESRHSDPPLRGVPVDGHHQFRLLVESVKDYAIFLLDTAGRIQSRNAGAQRAKGFQETDILGKHFSAFYPAAEREAGIPN